jgi:hypothetical protein
MSQRRPLCPPASFVRLLRRALAPTVPGADALLDYFSTQSLSDARQRFRVRNFVQSDPYKLPIGQAQQKVGMASLVFPQADFRGAWRGRSARSSVYPANPDARAALTSSECGACTDWTG